VLAEHFVHQLSEQNHWKPKSLSREALDALERYTWPGNVRELRNVIERALLLASGAEIDAVAVERALPPSFAAPGAAAGISGGLATGTLAQRVENFERETLLGELKRNRNHMTNTAKALGLERSHLYKKCQQLGIDLRALRQPE